MKGMREPTLAERLLTLPFSSSMSELDEVTKKAAAVITAAKALADAVEQWAAPMSLCDPHVGEVAKVRAEKLRAAAAAFRAAGG
jgi:hypothetical protein